jgi:hypothetical protein
MAAPTFSGLTMIYPDFDQEDPFTPALIIPPIPGASDLIEQHLPPPNGQSTMIVAEHMIGGSLPRFQGDTWTGGGFNRLYLNLIGLTVPPHKDLSTFGRMNYGTFAGSRPFQVVYPAGGSGTLQRSEWFSFVHDTETIRRSVTLELAKLYPDLAYWSIAVCFASPFFTMLGYFDSRHTYFVIEGLFWGNSSFTAQKDHLFPLEPTLFPLCLLFAELSLEEGGPLPSFLFQLFHEAVVRTTVTPKHLTKYPKTSILKVTATPYPYHKLIRFVIRSVIVMPSFTTQAEVDGWVVRDPEGTVTITVAIADEYSTNSFNLGTDIFTLTEMNTAWDNGEDTVGQIIGNTYVVAESENTSTEPLPAGSPISIQCATNECCAPVWAIEDTDAPESWGLSIDSDGLITGYIPRNETLGTYYITVSVTGPTQTVEATTYIDVTAPLVYGNVWVGKAKIDSNVTGLVEVGDNIFACTFEGGIFWAAKTDLTTWTEASYTGTPQRFAGIAKLTSTLLVAIEMQYTGTGSGHAYCWKSTDAGLNWVKITTQLSYGNSGGNGNGRVWAIDSATILWAANYLGTAAETSIVAGQIFDPVTEAIIDTVTLPNTAFVGNPGNHDSEFWYEDGVYVYAAHAGNVVKLYGCTGINALGFPAATLTLLGTYDFTTSDNPVVSREDEFTFAPATYTGSVIQTSSNGTTWTPTTITLGDTYRLYVLSPKAPGVIQLRTKYSAGTLMRTTDRWASGAGTEVLTGLGNRLTTSMPILEIELTGVLVLGCGGTTNNIFTSEE